MRLHGCKEILGSEADMAEQIRLDIEVIDLFLENAEKTVRENSRGGYAAVAKALREEARERLEEPGLPDFGSLAVEARAEDNKRYVIRPSWQECIYISEPDVMDGVTVEFNLLSSPDSPGHSRRIRYRGRMKIGEAVDLAEKFCRTERRSFSYMWDRYASEAWACVPATEKQRARVRRDFAGYGVADTPPGMLSKKDASELIGLASRISLEKERRLELSEAQRGSASESGLALKKPTKEEARAFNAYKERAGSEEGPSGEDEAEFGLFAQNVMRNASRAASERKDAVTCFRADGSVSIEVRPEYRPGPGPASSKQVNYIASLLRSVGARGYVLPGIDLRRITKSQAAGLIPLLKAMDDLPGRQDKIRLKDFGGFLDMLDRNGGSGKLVIKMSPEKPAAPPNK